MTTTLPILASAADWAGAAVGGGAGAAFVFVVLRWLLEWTGGRLDKRQAMVDDGVKNLIEGLERRVDALERELAETRDELRDTRKELHDCEHRHSQSEGEILKLKAVLQGQGEIRQLAAGAVAADRLAGERQ